MATPLTGRRRSPAGNCNVRGGTCIFLDVQPIWMDSPFPGGHLRKEEAIYAILAFIGNFVEFLHGGGPC